MYLPVNFYTGTYNEYKQLLDKKEIANNCLYFCEDRKVIFRGQEVIPVPYVVLENGELPIADDAIKDLLYLDNKSNKIYVYDENSGFVPIYGTNIVHADAIESINWEEDTRILTLPTFDENGNLTTLQIDLGQDLILNNAEYNADSKEIILYFETADTTDKVTIEPIRISVNDLIDLYKGDSTNSIQVDVEAHSDVGTIDERTITANLILYTPDLTNEKANAIIIKETGVYVPNLTSDISQAQSTADAALGDAGRAQDTADQALANAGIAQAAADNIAAEVHGERLVLNSPALTNTPTTPTVEKEVDWTADDNGELIASIAYVQNAIKYANTWRALRRNTTWAELRGE